MLKWHLTVCFFFFLFFFYDKNVVILFLASLKDASKCYIFSILPYMLIGSCMHAISVMEILKIEICAHFGFQLDRALVLRCLVFSVLYSCGWFECPGLLGIGSVRCQHP